MEYPIQADSVPRTKKMPQPRSIKLQSLSGGDKGRPTTNRQNFQANKKNAKG
jgi:hypothetical protein